MPTPELEKVLADLEEHNLEAAQLSQSLDHLRQHIQNLERVTKDLSSPRGMCRNDPLDNIKLREPSARQSVVKWALFGLVVCLLYHRTFYNLFVVTWQDYLEEKVSFLLLRCSQTERERESHQ